MYALFFPVVASVFNDFGVTGYATLRTERLFTPTRGNKHHVLYVMDRKGVSYVRLGVLVFFVGNGGCLFGMSQG